MRKTLLNYFTHFSKVITICWIFIWLETIIFSEVATIFNFGDCMAISTINENVKEIGIIITGFYFSTKCLENIFKGVEDHKKEMAQTECECDSEDEIDNKPQG